MKARYAAKAGNMMEKKALLSINRLTKIFNPTKPNQFIAVNGISFDLHEGEILGFLGPNGAGKTTTIQMLLGLMRPTSGTITYYGKDFEKYRSEILQSVTYASAFTKLAGRLTIYENLDIYGRLYQVPAKERAERIEKYLHFLGLWPIKDRYAGVLSAGQTTRLILAKAFLPKPRIVLLDEPTASLDPDVALDIRKFILTLRKEENISVLFTSHNMAEVEELCDRVLILKDGEIVTDNTPQEIARSMRQAKVHLMFDERDIPAVRALLAEKNYVHTLEMGMFIIVVPEERIAILLRMLAEHAYAYTQISIDKPNLEDYFIEIAHQTKRERL